jgi:cation:H+ antiporter
LPVWVVPVFVASAAVSLLASDQLVKALERVGTDIGAAQVLLGLVAALAADGPELTSAVTALLSGEHALGLGVLFGSNVFNIAALLGLGPFLAGRVRFHRRVVVMEGTAAVGVAVASLLLVSGALGAVPVLVLTLAFFVPYVIVAAVPTARLPLPGPWRQWLSEALQEEVEETQDAYRPAWRANTRLAGVSAVVAVLIVIGASVLMEHSASVGGTALGVPEVVLGGVVLAGVTSLPNAVAAVYLARAGKGAATLSVAMNSNTINVVGGLALPAVIGGFALAGLGGGTVFAGAAYLAMTALVILLAYRGAYRGDGLGRGAGALLLGAYAVFLGVLIAVG